MNLGDGRVKLWNRETGKPIVCYAVDAHEMLKQADGIYVDYDPQIYVDGGLGSTEMVEDVEVYGPPDLDDWTVRDLQEHLLKRFNEKWNKSEYPRKTDLVRLIRSLYEEEAKTGAMIQAGSGAVPPQILLQNDEGPPDLD